MYQSYQLITPHSYGKIAQFAIIDDELKEPIIINADNLWEAVALAYKHNDLHRNVIQFIKWHSKVAKLSNSLQDTIRMCNAYIPEVMKHPDMQKYLILL